MAMKLKDESTYSADDIDVVEGLEHVKQRPGMYIGSTGSKGLHHLIWEIVDNSIDEVSNGFGTKIKVNINKNGSITIEDDGRGIPIDIHKQKKIPAVRLIFEIIGAGGKFNTSTSYKTSGGLHGVGAAVVNALSKTVDIEICRDKKKYGIKYKNSKISQDLKVIGKSTKTGTKVTFMPDDKVFETVKFNYSTLKNKLKELAFLNKGILIELSSDIDDKQDSFKFDGGIDEFVASINEGKDIINSPIYITGEKDDILVEVALQYTQGYSENIYSYVNNINTLEGGKHEEGFRTGLTRSINEFFKAEESKKKRPKEIAFQGSDVVEGLTAILSIKMRNVEFEGQTKTKLGNPEVRGIVLSIVYEGLVKELNKNKSNTKKILDKITNAYESRHAAKAARDIARKKSKLNNASIVSIGKLADCSSKNPKEKEIFIVEGESAGGSAKQGRNRKTQAILSLKGKPMNVEKKSIKDILNNEEMVSLIRAVNGGIGAEFNVDNINYHKIIIATDADVDGSHIRLILLTFFYRYMRPLIEGGYVYIANPPLFKIYNKTKSEYAYSIEDLEKVKKKFGKNYSIQRYKGLGEMNPDQLFDTTMCPDNRTLIRVSMEDSAEADKLLSIAMGTKVAPRREYLEEHL